MYVGNYWNFAYFWVNVKIFQNTIMDDANVSKQIDEERCLSIKQEIVLQYDTENVTTNFANVLAWVTHPDSQNQIEEQWRIGNILYIKIQKNDFVDKAFAPTFQK